MKKIKSLATFFITLCLTFLSLVGVFGCNSDNDKDKQTVAKVTYIGMNVSDSSASTFSAKYTPFTANAQPFSAWDDEAVYKQYLIDNNYEAFATEVVFDGTKNTGGGATNKWGIDDKTVKCVYSPEFVLTINLNNPDEYEILSLTINGKKIQSYQFLASSTSTKINIQISNVETYGLHKYEIDAIKYIDGTEIMDAKMDAETTVSVYVVKRSVTGVFDPNVLWADFPILIFRNYYDLWYSDEDRLFIEKEDSAIVREITASKISIDGTFLWDENSAKDKLLVTPGQGYTNRKLYCILTNSDNAILGINCIKKQNSDFKIEFTGEFNVGETYYINYCAVGCIEGVEGLESNKLNWGLDYPITFESGAIGTKVIKDKIFHYYGKETIKIPIA